MAQQRCHWQVPGPSFFPFLRWSTNDSDTCSLQFPLSKAQISWVPCCSSYTSTVPWPENMATSCYPLLSAFWKRMYMCIVEVSTRCISQTFNQSSLDSLCLKCLNWPGHKSHLSSVSNMWATAAAFASFDFSPAPQNTLASACKLLGCSVTGNQSGKQKTEWTPGLVYFFLYFGPITPNIEPGKREVSGGKTK